MRNAFSLATGLALFAMMIAGDARACGGCFHPPPQPAAVDSVVTGHRMAFAVSANRTVLWDQIKYTGSPTDFGWVLPVTPGATIEASTDAWFEALDGATTVSVAAPQLKCAQTSGNGFACGSSTSASAGVSNDSTFFEGHGVTVVHEGTVGPFETVTLHSTDAGSLRTWLSGHSYIVPDDISPIIDAYVKEGADFIALKLIPGQGVQQMTPVRVVTPSGKPILPLRMVAAGTGSSVDIVLFVIGEHRFTTKDLAEVHVDPSALTYDYATSTTNYLLLRQQALADNVGANFLTTFAAQHPFDQTPNSQGFTDPQSGNFASNLAELYFQRAFSDDGRSQETSCGSAESALSSGLLLADATAAQALACDKYDDLAAAEQGMHPDQVWLTRLEMTLPREALSMDCNVGPAASDSAVSNDLVALTLKNRPPGCPDPIFESRIAREPTSPTSAFAWAIAALGLVGVLRRARRRS